MIYLTPQSVNSIHSDNINNNLGDLQVLLTLYITNAIKLNGITTKKQHKLFRRLHVSNINMRQIVTSKARCSQTFGKVGLSLYAAYMTYPIGLSFRLITCKMLMTMMKEI